MSDKNAAGQDVPSIDLLCCPFCGNEVELSKTGGDMDGPGSINVDCTGCNVSFRRLAMKKHLWSDPTDKEYENDVIAAFNTRAT